LFLLNNLSIIDVQKYEYIFIQPNFFNKNLPKNNKLTVLGIAGLASQCLSL